MLSVPSWGHMMDKSPLHTILVHPLDEVLEGIAVIYEDRCIKHTTCFKARLYMTEVWHTKRDGNSSDPCRDILLGKQSICGKSLDMLKEQQMNILHDEETLQVLKQCHFSCYAQ